ncbi:MAG: CPBP family intramembrane metalloprotease [Lachnospiraceae bacterium]|nr:CPBP family intramembrane metalloprotease [Lachnospiraceae bacterium]
MKMDKKKLKIYLIWTFAIAWVLQVIGSIFSLQGNSLMFTLVLSVSMYAPFFGTLLARVPLQGMGLKPKLKGNLKYFAAAWLLPAVFTALGAVLYFIIFPDRLDLTGMYIREAGGEGVIQQLEAEGLTLSVYMAISVISAPMYAPWINMFFALGEEVGWRGAMDPMLRDYFGKAKGSIIGGMIWGAWHWPVMIIAGYEYGKGYWGEPILGMVLFCLFAVVAGTLLDYLYEKTDCIWAPALAHGAINGVCSVPMLFLNTAYSNQLTIGPLPIGFISMIPMMIVAAIVLWQQKKQEEK